jgi:hypothetical protein
MQCDKVLLVCDNGTEISMIQGERCYSSKGTVEVAVFDKGGKFIMEEGYVTPWRLAEILNTYSR